MKALWDVVPGGGSPGCDSPVGPAILLRVPSSSLFLSMEGGGVSPRRQLSCEQPRTQTQQSRTRLLRWRSLQEPGRQLCADPQGYRGTGGPPLRIKGSQAPGVAGGSKL